MYRAWSAKTPIVVRLSTLLYRIVAAEIGGLRNDLANASPHGSGLPKHVDKELERYLSCGQLHRGFARVA